MAAPIPMHTIIVDNSNDKLSWLQKMCQDTSKKSDDFDVNFYSFV